MINRSIENGIFPYKLKIAKIVPILKFGDQIDPDNYRPISLLSLLNQIYAKIMYNRLISFVGKHSILSTAQYGFRKQHSTQHAIIEIVDKIYKKLNNKEFTWEISINLKKVFDTVDHNILLSKLYHRIRRL